ncbi:methyltransferase domain-containing protein [Candidatus Gottesmanbacteria bacterium]|nr:methyltransferase domain-containing protein [Candidatus Gottesmanbacteria bacterium]
MRTYTHNNRTQQIINYYHTWESRVLYSLILRGTKHFGYYPQNKFLPLFQALRLMEDKLAEKLALPPNSLILDAGCGEGNVAIYLSKNYSYRIKGIDILNFNIQKANQKKEKFNLHKQLEFFVGDYTLLQFPSEMFDAVYTMETLVHATNYTQALKAFYRVLKPDGRLVLFEYSISSKTHATQDLRQLMKMIIEASGMHALPHFEHGVYSRILKQAGFTHVSVEDITSKVLPFLQTFYYFALIPYQIIKLLKLQRQFVNTTSVIEGYRHIPQHHYWRYNIISARKSAV